MQIQTPYAQAVLRRYPESIAIAIARDAAGKHNPITLGWMMLTSHQPPMMAISVGLTRHSLGAIRHAKAFVISLPSVAMADDALFFGTKSGRDMDKIAARGTKTQPATLVDSVLFTDAVANFECTLESEMETGDHVIFAGRVVAAHVHQDPSLGRLYTLGKNYRMGGVTPMP
ncbi:MAG: flavin reductase family protein [Phycisphaerae bacterium]|nr:flavin reductase family protein [Phycisphaerae bacterium]